jgi:hypothetical protein
MTQLRDRMRQQAAQAHADAATHTEAASVAPAPAVTEPTASAPDRPTAKTQRRRRSPWVNPYPDAMPFQTSVYLTNDDLELIKELRFRLRFAREWMVLKYALERLKVELDRGTVHNAKGGTRKSADAVNRALETLQTQTDDHSDERG